MASRAQQIDHTERENMNRLSLKLNNKVYIFLSLKMFVKLYFVFHLFNRFLSLKLPNFELKLTIY